MMRLQGFAVAVLTVEFDPTTEHLVEGRVGLIFRIRQRPLVMGNFLLEGGAAEKLPVQERLQDDLTDRLYLPGQHRVPIL
jgi:hypothetical protein